MNVSFWSGVAVGVAALAGVLGLIGSWASERQDGGLPLIGIGKGKVKKPRRKPRRTGEK